MLLCAEEEREYTDTPIKTKQVLKGDRDFS